MVNAVAEYIRDLLVGAWSLIAGLSVTIRYMVKPVVTVQYPRQKLPLPEAYRGHIELVRVPETDTHRCVACGECSRTCPSGVIKVQGIKNQASDHNCARFYFIDFSRCSFCGLCVQVCPQEALKFSMEYEQVSDTRYVGVVDLIARLDKDARS